MRSKAISPCGTTMSLRGGLVLDQPGHRDRGDAVLHRADILEQARHFPHDPLRHAPQPEHEADDHGNCADRHSLAEPQPDRHRGHRKQQQRVDHVERAEQRGDEPHRAIDRLQKARHAFPGERGFAPRMRKQLHRLDVGVAVDHAAGHRRARIGLLLGDLAEPRDEVAQQQGIAAEPDRQWRSQPPVGRADDEQHAEEIDDDVVQDVDQLDDAFAHGKCRLHQLGGDAAGELVLVEGHRLLEQIAMHLPADAHGIVAHQRLLVDQRMDPYRSGQHEHDDEGHARQLPALGGKEGLAVLRRQPVDDPAEEAEHPDFRDGDRRYQHRIDEDEGPGAARIVQAESDKRLRRLDRLFRRERVQSLFKPAEHCRGTRLM